jgi:hypothetical protein
MISSEEMWVKFVSDNRYISDGSCVPNEVPYGMNSQDDKTSSGHNS